MIREVPAGLARRALKALAGVLLLLAGLDAGQDVKRLLEFGSRGPRKVAPAAALRPPERLHPFPAYRHGTVQR